MQEKGLKIKSHMEKKASNVTNIRARWECIFRQQNSKRCNPTRDQSDSLSSPSDLNSFSGITFVSQGHKMMAAQNKGKAFRDRHFLCGMSDSVSEGQQNCGKRASNQKEEASEGRRPGDSECRWARGRAEEMRTE